MNALTLRSPLVVAPCRKSVIARAEGLINKTVYKSSPKVNPSIATETCHADVYSSYSRRALPSLEWARCFSLPQGMRQHSMRSCSAEINNNAARFPTRRSIFFDVIRVPFSVFRFPFTLTLLVLFNLG